MVGHSLIKINKLLRSDSQEPTVVLGGILRRWMPPVVWYSYYLLISYNWILATTKYSYSWYYLVIWYRHNQPFCNLSKQAAWFVSTGLRVPTNKLMDIHIPTVGPNQQFMACEQLPVTQTTSRPLRIQSFNSLNHLMVYCNCCMITSTAPMLLCWGSISRGTAGWGFRLADPHPRTVFTLEGWLCQSNGHHKGVSVGS